LFCALAGATAATASARSAVPINAREDPATFMDAPPLSQILATCFADLGCRFDF
jgi:hypothetical protein